MIRISCLTIFIFILNMQNAISQIAEDIITDRPDVTESSFTVPKSSIQIESGFVYSRNEYSSEESFNDTTLNIEQTDQFINSPGILARYGLTDKIELRLGAQLTFHRSENDYPYSSSSTETDIDGIEVAAKFKLADQNKLIPSIAVIAGSALPPVSTNFFSEFKLQPAIIFCLSNDITEDFGAGYNIGINFTDWVNTNSSSGIYSFSLSYSASDALGFFAEYYGEVPFQGGKAVNYTDAGFTVLIKNNLQIDLSGGYGLNSDITEYFINTGLSFRLPN